MRIYKHYRPRAVMFPLLLCGGLSAIGVVAFAWSLLADWKGGPPSFFFLFLVAVGGINGWVMGGFAIEARLGDDGFVEFVGPLRRVRTAVLDIVSIVPSEMSQVPVYVVRHRSGRFRLDARLNGMHELIAELKRLNPAIELRGI